MSEPRREKLEESFASLCLLSYDRPGFIETAVTTAVENAKYPLEVIVHDDGSNPATVDTLMALREKGYITTLILNSRGHNEGQGIAMNRMAAVAKGDPIIKADHDLIFAPEWLKKSVDILERNRADHKAPEIGALGLFPYFHPPVNYNDMLIRQRDGWEEHRDFVGSCILMTRRAWRAFGPWRERLPEFAEDALYKEAVTKAHGWCCALTGDVLVENKGFGPGPSTVVYRDESGQVQVSKIKEGPKVIGR